MNLKAALLSTLLGGLAIFMWGAAAHMIPPEPVTVLSDHAAVDDFLAKNAPRNGSYLDARGVMISVGFLPDRADKSVNMGPQLASEFLTNLLQAFMLYWILLRFKRDTILGYGVTGLAIALFAWVTVELSYWTWYSFSMPLVLMGLLDAVGSGFLAGAIAGWQIRKSA